MKISTDPRNGFTVTQGQTVAKGDFSSFPDPIGIGAIDRPNWTRAMGDVIRLLRGAITRGKCSMTGPTFTPDEESRISEHVRRVEIMREARRRSSLVGADGLQELDDLVKALNDLRARGGSIGRIAGCASDLVDEVLELLRVHGSPSVGDSTVAPALVVDGWGSVEIVGTGAGVSVGAGVGSGVGSGVGTGDGSTVGSGVGVTVGSGVGSGVGSTVGVGVGTTVGVGSGQSPFPPPWLCPWPSCAPLP